MNYTNFKIFIILTISITTIMSFDCNMFPIIKKLFDKNICYNKYNKNYYPRNNFNRKYRKYDNNHKMTTFNNNLRNTSYDTKNKNVSNMTLDYSNYLNNLSPSSNN